MTKKMRKGLSAVLLVVFLVSGSLLIWNFFRFREGENAYDDARALASGSPAAPQTTEPPAQAPTEETGPRTCWIPAPIEEEDPYIQALEEMDIGALRQVNEDVLGWIQIPDTKVDYPLLQGEDNQFYLENNWKGKKEYVGSIFLEYRNDPQLTDFNTIIYGHNMANGSMFGSLRQYQYGNHWKKHPYVYILCGAGVLRYEVFSTYTADVDSLTYGLSFQQMETRAEFLAMALENSEIDTGVLPELTDQILTLSTCSGVGYSTRRVVHARLKMVEVEME